MAFELKSEIMSEISKTEDERMRVVLLLLLGVMEYGAEEIIKVGKKIDELRTDEQALRRTVLNGLAETHHADHEWVNEHKKFSEANQHLINKAKPLMEWVESQIAAEEEMRQNRKTFAQKILEGAANQIGTISVTAIVTYMAMQFFGRGL
jgi:predicted PurR-regulated permease PerM